MKRFFKYIISSLIVPCILILIGSTSLVTWYLWFAALAYTILTFLLIFIHNYKKIPVKKDYLLDIAQGNAAFILASIFLVSFFPLVGSLMTSFIMVLIMKTIHTIAYIYVFSKVDKK